MLHARKVFGAIRRFSSAQAKQVYLVVGANGGIGSNLTEQLLLSSDSVNVAVACRSADAMSELVKKITDGPAGKSAEERILPIRLDATVPGSFYSIFVTSGGYAHKHNINRRGRDLCGSCA